MAWSQGHAGQVVGWFNGVALGTILRVRHFGSCIYNDTGHQFGSLILASRRPVSVLYRGRIARGPVQTGRHDFYLVAIRHLRCRRFRDLLPAAGEALPDAMAGSREPVFYGYGQPELLPLLALAVV